MQRLGTLTAALCRFAPQDMFKLRDVTEDAKEVVKCVRQLTSSPRSNYTLLHFEAVTACLGAGLDPHIGFYHELAHGRESLASDLIEPLRPRVDRWVWQLFRNESLTAGHFAGQGAGVRLGKAGRRVFYSGYETWVGPCRRALKRGAQGLVKVMAREQETIR